MCYPVQTSLVGAAILRVFDEKQTGKHKVAPWNIAAEKKNKGTLAKEHGVSQAMKFAHGGLLKFWTKFHLWRGVPNSSPTNRNTS